MRKLEGAWEKHWLKWKGKLGSQSVSERDLSSSIMLEVLPQGDKLCCEG